MNSRNAIEALTLQNQRLTGMLRGIDNGLWWATDPAAKLDADKILVQAEIIRAALDETSVIAARIAA
ncbi:hypothetical protein AFCDBAGC_2750 [Methylobacterium cerastii]|uniref:Uncharacterized protein n=1 Tax=Methylobacterium cerastii TaxID=932741 RepID=A0ABQ4QHY6_9HYPH|nr:MULTISPECIES: hypothetical protein [Methylobacterium]TXN81517.1 hypothetical protein FV234_13370 [Methylobacterium sp. WL8]GJD44881.1 hypothetical protein AFCDBAGC_2750 [Methylobacterium cerastii]